MKQAYVSEKFGIVTLSIIHDNRPSMQISLDLGFAPIFAIDLPFPEDEAHNSNIIFNQGIKILIEQLHLFLNDRGFLEDTITQVISNIICSLDGYQQEEQSEEAAEERENDIDGGGQVQFHEIKIPLTDDFVQQVQDHIISNKTASEYVNRAVEFEKRLNTRLQDQRDQNQRAKEDAAGIINRYKSTIQKSVPGPLYVTLYDRFGKPSGVARVTNQGVTKWAKSDWATLLARFPKQFQQEIKAERKGDVEDIRELSGWQLRSPTPLEIPLKSLLSRNLDSISMASDEAIAIINKKWKLDIRPASQRYDKNPERYSQYSKMDSSTAQPSVMVNNEIYWGVGRFIAALMRGDKTLKVWDVINTKSASIQKVSFIAHMPGHKNSKGEAAAWVIKSHETGKILSSHKTKAEAKKHLQEMHIFSSKSALFNRDTFNFGDRMPTNVGKVPSGQPSLFPDEEDNIPFFESPKARVKISKEEEEEPWICHWCEEPSVKVVDGRPICQKCLDEDEKQENKKKTRPRGVIGAVDYDLDRGPGTKREVSFTISGKLGPNFKIYVDPQENGDLEGEVHVTSQGETPNRGLPPFKPLAEFEESPLKTGQKFINELKNILFQEYNELIYEAKAKKDQKLIGALRTEANQKYQEMLRDIAYQLVPLPPVSKWSSLLTKQ